MSSHEQIDANVLMNGNGVGNGSTVVMDSDRGSTTSRELGYQVHLTSINGMDLDGLSESEIRERFTRTDSITIAARASRIRLPSSDTVMTAPLSSSSSFRGVDGGGHMDNDHDEADDNTCIQNADESRSLLRTVKTSKTENDDLRNEIENYAEYHSNFEQVRIEALEERVLRLESKGSGETLLPQDSFSFFVTGGLWAMVFSCCIFLFQLLFLALLLSDPLVVDWQAVEDWILEAKPLGNFLMLPYSVSIQVRITEGLALLFAAIAQDDIIQACNVIHIGYDAVGHGRKAKDSSSRIERTFTHARKWKWVVHLVMRFLEGFVSLIATFIIIMRERSVVEILLSFASLEFVAKLDDISFKLCEWGFFGEYFREQARTINASKPIEGESKKEKNRCWRHLRLIIMIAVVCFFWLGLALISEKGQKNGYYLSLDFPKCTFERQTIHEIQDGICEEEDIEWSKYIGMYQNLTAHSKYNVKDCGWDGGDCKIVNDYFVKAYSISCTAEGGDVNRIRDGTCDKANNIKQCGYDGGDCYKFNNNENITSPAIKTEGYNCKDCCNVAFPDRVGDGNCNAFGGYNTQECDYDGGDCKGFNANYATTANSNCTEHDPPCCDVEFPDLLGDEECNDGKGGYNTEGCGWDGGDCLNETHFPNCTGIDPARLRDKTCDGGNYNTEECGWDGGDCLIRDYPNCHVDIPDRVRDERCDADANTEECGWDGGDCDSLNVELWKTLPNCTQGIDPRQIKDSICNGGLYNTIECGFDGGACDEFNQNYPACSVDDPYKVGDKQCNGGAYNTTECGYDGGDCVSFSPSTSPSIFPTILPTKVSFFIVTCIDPDLMIFAVEIETHVLFYFTLHASPLQRLQRFQRFQLFRLKYHRRCRRSPYHPVKTTIMPSTFSISLMFRKRKAVDI